MRLYSLIYEFKMKQREWKVSVPWGEMAVVSWGDLRNEKVLLCHGRKDNLATFYPLMELMPDNFYYVAVDMPGSGLSDPFPGAVPLSVMVLTMSIRTLTEAMNWYKFIYIGHSMGGEIGELFNAAYPGRITKLIQLDTTIISTRYSMPYDALLEGFIEYHYTRNYNKIIKRDTGKRYTKEEAISALSSSRGISGRAAEQIALRNIVPCDDGLFRFNWDVRMNAVAMLGTKMEYYIDILTSADVPTLVLNATRMNKKQGYLPGYDTIYDIQSKKKSKRSTYVIVNIDAIHDLHIVNTEEVAKHIIWFMKNDFNKLNAKL